MAPRPSMFLDQLCVPGKQPIWKDGASSMEGNARYKLAGCTLPARRVPTGNSGSMRGDDGQTTVDLLAWLSLMLTTQPDQILLENVANEELK